MTLISPAMIEMMREVSRVFPILGHSNYGGDFGFDNIAAALKISPLLLEGYLTAALRISDTAIGDAEAEPGTVTYSISTVVTHLVECWT